MKCFLFSLFLNFVFVVKAADVNNDNDNNGNKESKRRIISLAESIEITRNSLRDPEVEKVRKKFWDEAFSDIRKLTRNTERRNMTNGFLSQWKTLSSLESVESETTTVIPTNNFILNATIVDEAEREVAKRRRQLFPQRFDGFPTWERMLQEWNDEIQEYLDQISDESENGYAMGNYGRAPATKIDEKSDSVEKVLKGVPLTSELKQESKEMQPILKPVSEKTIPIPIPAPAQPGEEVLPHTDISDKSKRILVVTTASLPWKTGTAVNPLLRAAYLVNGRKQAGGDVTLMLPWLERMEDQVRVYGADSTFDTPEDQEQYIRTWLKDSANMVEASTDLKIQWYTAWQNRVENSIYSMGDITALISDDDVDICILEEPEHLNWYRAPGESWTKKFKHVVGILHTNYFSYALDQPAALIRAPAMRLLCSWMCRIHCHRVIKLSGTLDKVAPEKELVENVHGVRGTFLSAGKQVDEMLRKPTPESVFRSDAEPTVYFIGKMLWSKGIGSLMELLKYAEESANLSVTCDMYGGGPDMDAASKKAEKLGLNLPFHGPLDHAELASTHKIFVNPSTSEVLCTTTAEALAMGKFAIIPSHPSNDFFAQFPNCLTYATKEEFVGNLYYAMTHAPEPMTGEYAHALTWEAANQRLEAAACIPKAEYDKLQEALTHEEAAVEISLPPLVDSEDRKKGLSTVLRFLRLQYRLFRTRLSMEIQETKVLPQAVKTRLIAELDKRLDLDIDELLDSPKLRLKLSPAELDKNLLEFYNSISLGPGGDILRVIGGGGQVGLQNLYMRRRAEYDRWRKLREGVNLEIFPSFQDDESLEPNTMTTSQLIRRSLRNSVPKLGAKNTLELRWNNNGAKKLESSNKEKENTPLMCYGTRNSMRNHYGGLRTWTGFRPPRSSKKFSILI